LKAHLRCCEPHLSHHPTNDLIDFYFSLLPQPQHRIARRSRLFQTSHPHHYLRISYHNQTIRQQWQTNHGMKYTTTSTSTKNTPNTQNRGAWAKPRPATSRTPQQSRSSNASPAPPSTTAAPPAAAKPTTPAAPPAANVWAQRTAAQKATPAVTAAPKGVKKEQGAATPVAQEKHVAVNNFNDGEVRQMTGRGEASAVCKVDASATNKDRECFPQPAVYTGSLTPILAACMSSGKNFWDHLKEQVKAAQQKESEKQ
jgi:hypothetical protein